MEELDELHDMKGSDEKFDLLLENVTKF